MKLQSNNIDEYENEDENDICSICMNNLNGNSVIITNCKHKFHSKCISEWYIRNNSCPLCREKVA